MRKLKAVTSHLLAIVLVVACAVVSSKFVRFVRAQNVATPFFVTLHEVVYQSGKAPVVTRTFGVGQRSDGARTEVHWSTTPKVNFIRIEFPAQGLWFLTNNLNHNIVKAGKGRPYVNREADATCKEYGGLNAIGNDKMLGFDVIHTYLSKPSEDRDAWIAPSLGCMTLKETHLWKDNGTRNSEMTILEAIKATAGDPPPEYFLIPDDAKDTKPTDYFTALGAGPPGNNWDNDDKIWADNKAFRNAK